MPSVELQAWIIYIVGMLIGLFTIRTMRGRWGLLVLLTLGTFPALSSGQANIGGEPTFMVTLCGTGTILNPAATTTSSSWYMPLGGTTTAMAWANPATTPGNVSTTFAVVAVAFKAGPEKYYLGTMRLYEGGSASGTQKKVTLMAYQATKTIHLFISINDGTWEELGLGTFSAGVGVFAYNRASPTSSAYHDALGEPSASTGTPGIRLAGLHFEGGAVPSAPTALAVTAGEATGTEPDQVRSHVATWTHTGAGLTEFEVEHAPEANGPWTTMAPVASTGRTATLADVPADEDRYFRVRAGNEEGWSAWAGPTKDGDLPADPGTPPEEGEDMPWLTQGKDFITGDEDNSGIFQSMHNAITEGELVAGSGFADAYTYFRDILSNPDDMSENPASDIRDAMAMIHADATATQTEASGSKGSAWALWNQLIINPGPTNIFERIIAAVTNFQSQFPLLFTFIRAATSTMLVWTCAINCSEMACWAFGVEAAAFFSFLNFFGGGPNDDIVAAIEDQDIDMLEELGIEPDGTEPDGAGGLAQLPTLYPKMQSDILDDPDDLLLEDD